MASADVTKELGLPPLPSTNGETIGALLWAREVMQKHIKTKYSVTDPKGIEELKAIEIGGVDQWLHIRGRNRENPVLLLLHGGPGGASIGLTDDIQRPWEDFFTVVNWDQRQVGKSYYPADDVNAPLSVEQHIADTEEVIQHLLNYLNKGRIFVLGMSWGTVLGMHIVKRLPECLHAYIGVGQVVNLVSNEKAICQRLVEQARDQDKSELVGKIVEISRYLDRPSPEKERYWYGKDGYSQVVRAELSKLTGEMLMRHLSWSDAINLFKFEKLISPHLTINDIANSIFGDRLALYRPPHSFAEDFFRINLPKDIGSAFEVPIFFFSGSHDWQTPTVLSDVWFEQISAPHKELVHFENSAHVVLNEEPGRVLISLVNKVLPFAGTSSQKLSA